MLIEEEKSSSQEEKIKNKEEEEDLSIDFSGIKEKAKKFFKNIKSDHSEDKESEDQKNDEDEKKSQEENIEKKDEEEDLAINFSEMKEKAKKFFKNIKSDNSKDKDESDKKSDEDEIGLDIKKITSYAKKNSKWLIPLALILIAVFLSSYFRMMPTYLPVTDDWATNTVYNYYRGQIGNQINQQYPNLPQQNKNVLIEKEWQKQFKENKEMIKQQVKTTSQQYKSQLQDDSGQTYLLAIDPYLWYGESRNYINNGHFGTEIVDSKEINFLRNGREGRPGEPGSAFHLYFEVFLYKLVHFFSKETSLMSVVFLIPVIIIGLSIIPAFLMGRIISGNVGGFFASIIVATNTALLSRTPAGFSDTDAYNIFFPLLILWLFLKAFDAKDIKNKVINAGLAGLSCGLYSAAWGGWWYAFGFAIATLAIYSFYAIVINFRKIKKNNSSLLQLKDIFFVGITFILSSALFVSIFSSFKTFIDAFTGPLHIITLKEVATASIWPNVLTTVAEFNTIPLETIISQMGGKILFFIAIFGIILTTTKKNPEGNRNVEYAIFLIIWFIGTAYGFTKGIRFGILMVPAFAIAFGAGVGMVYQYASKWLARSIRIDKRLTETIIIVLICLLLISSIKATSNTAKNEIPSMNDAWYNSLTKIKDNTTDAITTSWWDFGHWFVAISERRVTFDGADQGERIHWVGKTLLTSDEQISVGLLRMLNCGQEKPPHVLEDFFEGDTIKAVDVLNKIMILNNKKEAIKLLKKEGLSNQQIAEIIKITYCDNLIDQFYITSEDMVGKAGVWGHFGSWDFRRAAMYQAVTKNKVQGKQILIDKFNLTEEEADNYYYQITTTPADQWVSPWPGYQGNAGCNKEGDNLICNINTGQGTARLEIELKTMNASIQSNNGAVYPNSLVYATKDGIEEKKFEGNLMGVSVVLLPESNQILLTHPLQAKSIFTQLFFLEGHGLKCFKKFDDVRQFTGGRIITWKVDFDCKQENKIYFQPKKVENNTQINETEDSLENKTELKNNETLSQEEVRAAHILISTENRSEEEALELIKEIQKNITADNFAEYAQKYSDGPSSINGGELGWFEKGVMVFEFEEAAFSLEKEEISEPVKTQFGYHLIIILDKK